MAKYNVDYSCGHSATLQLYGPEKDRTRKIDWLERSGLCKECFDAKREADFAARNAEAAAENAPLPALTGSEKQIAWAESIRRDAIAGFERLKLGWQPTAQAIVGLVNDPRFGEIDLLLKSESAALKAQTSAKWWIDNREIDHGYKIWQRCKAAIQTLFAVEIEHQRAVAEQAKAEEAAADRTERRDAEQSKVKTSELGEFAASNFRIVRAEREGSALRIYGEDGHEAKGYVEDGEWVVYQIDDLPLNSLLPAAVALANRVKQICTATAA